MENNERPILSILQDINSKSLSGKTLDKETRKQCVQVMLSEGYNVPQVAQTLGLCQKTIRRDILEIQAQNMLNTDANTVKATIGNMMMKAETHSSFLMRLARSREGSVGERVQAEYLAWKVTDELMKLLQSLGFLPIKPKEVVGDFFHHFNDENEEKSFIEVREELNRVINISRETGTLTPELEQKAALLNQKIEKAEIVHATNNVIQRITEIKQEDKDE